MPSAVDGPSDTFHGCRSIPSSTSKVRFSGSSTTKIRALCSEWTHSPSTTNSESASSPVCPNGECPTSWPEAQRLGQRLVERQVAGDGAADLGDVEGVGEPGDVVVALGVHEDLGLVLQPAERLRVEDAVTVALEGGAVAVGELGHRPALRLRRPRRPGGEQLVLEPFRVLSGAAEERSGHSSPSSGQPLGRHALGRLRLLHHHRRRLARPSAGDVGAAQPVSGLVVDQVATVGEQVVAERGGAMLPAIEVDGDDVAVAAGELAAGVDGGAQPVDQGRRGQDQLEVPIARRRRGGSSFRRSRPHPRWSDRMPMTASAKHSASMESPSSISMRTSHTVPLPPSVSPGTTEESPVRFVFSRQPARVGAGRRRSGGRGGRRHGGRGRGWRDRRQGRERGDGDGGLGQWRRCRRMRRTTTRCCRSR